MDVLQLEVEDQYDAFLLDPGMGPMTYLTADGRVLQDERTWFGDSVHESRGLEAIASIVVGAKKTGITELLDLVPACPKKGLVCPLCEARSWENEMVCRLCRGRGWVLQPELDDLRAKGYWPFTPTSKNS